MKTVTITLTAAALLVATPTLADNIPEQNKVLYEVQERCNQRAQDFFDHQGRLWGDQEQLERSMPGNLYSKQFENHYNARLNKCFIVINTDVLNIDPRKGKPWVVSDIWDINDHKEIGIYARDTEQPPLLCHVAGTLCTDDPSWDKLIKPYMEDDQAKPIN